MVPLNEIWIKMAGARYSEMIASRDSAMNCLFDKASKTRIAAIHICDIVWECSGDPDFAVSCERLATADDDDSVRFHAIAALGKSFRGSKNSSITQFLISLLKNPKSSEITLEAAYWALREVQLGLTEQDNTTRALLLVKQLFEMEGPADFQAALKDTKSKSPQMTNLALRIPDDIDWDFVESVSKAD